MYPINGVVLFKEISGTLFSAFNSACFNLEQPYTSLLLSAKTAYACQQWLFTHYYLLPCNSINLHNSCMCMQSLLFWVLWSLPCFMAYVNNLKFKAYSILVMFILTYQFLWFWSHSKDLHNPENNLWYSIITYVTHEGWITPTLCIYILSFSSITIVF